MDEDFTPRRERRDSHAAIATDEDFLYHLSRGSDFLIENRVVEAKEELERALSFRPEDAKSQDLLAGVYFRLGVYPRAIEIWSRLARTFPDDVTLRVNLGLALLKTGQPDDALVHLGRAIAIEPEHARAWGYIGLVQWRLGNIEEARDAFSRGGQASMARRMEELVAESAEELGRGLPTPIEPASAHDVDALRTSAGEAIATLDRAHAPLVLEREARERKPSGAWRVTEAGADSIPRTAQPSRPVSADAPMSLAQLLDWWAPSIPVDQALTVTPSGALVIATKTAVHARASAVRAVRGTFARVPVSRRFRRGAEEAMGDDEPVLRWEGDLVAVIAPRAGERFQALRIDDDVLYVVERFVQAFDDRVSFESGRLPGHAGDARLVQFRGTGIIVLRTPRAPTAMPIKSGADARVSPDALLGWTGRLFPVDLVPDPASESGADGATLALRGDGTLLLV